MQIGKHVQHQATMSYDDIDELDKLLDYDPDDHEEGSKKTTG